eukprot:GHVH01014307.1.p1 GENE.GHVH01014307.1~~GHVH01014307.1.p1  ORF type:complete len:450 (-),score=49.84 GHVH01014307.1:31-1380(-)
MRDFMHRRTSRRVPLVVSDGQFDESAIPLAVKRETIEATSGLRWCDFPVSLLDPETLRSTYRVLRPQSFFMRAWHCMRRLSVVNLLPIRLQFPSQIPYTSIAADTLEGFGVKARERTRMAKNIPAPAWGISRRVYYKYGNSEISQDAFPNVPASCVHQNDGLADKGLELDVCQIGRAAARPIRFALASVFSSVVCLSCYVASTVVYLTVYTTLKVSSYPIQRENEIILSSSTSNATLISAAVNRSFGLIIMNFLFWAFFNFLIGVFMIEWKRTECLKVIQNECEVMNKIWKSQDESTADVHKEPKILRSLHLLVQDDLWSDEGSQISAQVRLFDVLSESKSIFSRILKTFKGLVRSGRVYGIRYIEEAESHKKAEEYSMSTTEGVTLKKDDSLTDDDSSGLNPQKDDLEETDDFDSSDDNPVGNTVPSRVILVPLIHSQLTLQTIIRSA